jgi:hypothetical protein
MKFYFLANNQYFVNLIFINKISDKNIISYQFNSNNQNKSHSRIKQFHFIYFLPFIISESPNISVVALSDSNWKNIL